MPADAPEPAHRIGHVRAEHAAVRVDLVDDHEPQVGEEAAPARVVGQDSLMEHVGVRQDHVALVAQAAPNALGRVAVIRARLKPDVVAHFGEAIERAQLVLGQGLGGVHVQHGRVRIGEDRLDRRDLIAQGLAAGRARYDDHVAAAAHLPDGVALVTVEPVHAQRREGGVHPGVGHHIPAVPRRTGGDLLHVDDLASEEPACFDLR